jgi:hypothetical protein
LYVATYPSSSPAAQNRVVAQLTLSHARAWSTRTGFVHFLPFQTEIAPAGDAHTQNAGLAHDTGLGQ